MAAKTINMLQIRRILQLHQSGTSGRSIASQLKMSRNTVKFYLAVILQNKLSIEELLTLDDSGLGLLIHDIPDSIRNDNRLAHFRSQLTFFENELKRIGVTRQILWQEYKIQNPDGYSYSQFCDRLMHHLQCKDVSMHLEYKAGEKLMFDFAGKKFSVIDTLGKKAEWELLVATFPYSGYTYIEAVASQRQGDFIRAMENALVFFGGSPQCLITDNLKSSVIKYDRYDPDINELMQQFCLHYNTSLMPARPRKPRDKPHVEKAVHLAYQRVYAPLRNRTFDSLHELNEAIREQTEIHHDRPFRRSQQSRRDLFKNEEQPLLAQLPSARMEIQHTVEAKVQKTYHIVLGVDWHYYSVPFEHVGQQVKIIYTERTVEIYNKHNRIAIHPRDRKKNGYSTLNEHMPERHRKYQELRGWKEDDFLFWARKISPEAEQVIKKVMESRFFYEQTFNACLGILKLAGKYSPERLTKACEIALRAKATTYRFISNVLKNNTDLLDTKLTAQSTLFPEHENIRGPNAYQ